MVNLFDVAPNDLIDKAAEELKKDSQFTAPVWSSYVKTGMHKQRPPVEGDWWHTRCASILRSVAKLGPIGVSKLRTKYGGRKNRGVKPDKFYKGGGSILRKGLQQLEKAGYVRQTEKGCHKGRIITPTGKSFLDKIAVSLLKENKKDNIASKSVESLTESKNSKREVPKAEVKEEPKKEVKAEAPKTESK